MKKSRRPSKVSSRRYYKSFDSIKGLAVFIICLCGHYWQFSPGKYWTQGDKTGVVITNWFIHTGFRTYPGMELLLMISGFQLFNSFKKIGEGREKFPAYILKKIQRIFPMTILGTLLMVVGIPVYKALTGEAWYKMEVDFWHVVQNLLNVQTWFNTTHTLNGPLWYVSAYFFCLLLFFPLSWIAGKIPFGKKYNFGAVLMFIPFFFGIYTYGKGYDKILINNDMARAYFGFFAGVILAAFCQLLEDMKAKKWIIDTICILMIAGWFYIRLNHYDTIFKASLYVHAWLSMLLLFAPVMVLLTQNRFLDIIIGNPVLTGLGKISFAMYVLNFPFYIWSAIVEKTLGLNPPYAHYKMFWITVGIQVLIAIICYLFFERPIYKLGKKKAT